MLVLVCLAVLIPSLVQGTGCKDFGAWKTHDECMWLRGADGNMDPTDMRKGFLDACRVKIDMAPENMPKFPVQIPFPEKCGHCSFKIKCQSRPGAIVDGCFPVHAEKEICHDGPAGDVCLLPQVPMVGGCRWKMLGKQFTQCTTSRPDMPDWKRAGFKAAAEHFPEQNCIEKGDQCACCCHPFTPNADGTACVEAPPAPTDCGAMGEFNDWSQCLWYPMETIGTQIKDHCALHDLLPPPPPAVPIPTPAGFTIPEKCGFCSFKVRCAKRGDGAKKPGCFPLEMDKRACGTEDCPTCGDICTLPFLPETPLIGKCEYPKMLQTVLKNRAGALVANMTNYWKKRGMENVMANIPHGKCIEKDGACKCCCHPYEPTADGTACHLKDFCKIPSDLGVSWSIEEH